MKYKVVLLGVSILLIIMLSAGVAMAATVTGTNCNDWSVNTHKGLGEADNDRCDRPDLTGTNGSDTFYGKEGWDYIKAFAGNDTIFGGGGMDAPYGGKGDDDVEGGPGHDHIWGGSGNDRLDASDGVDEPNHIEEVHGGFKDEPDGTNDLCILDNDAGDIADADCDRVTVVNDDGSRITFNNNDVPSGVNITVK